MCFGRKHDKAASPAPPSTISPVSPNASQSRPSTSRIPLSLVVEKCSTDHPRENVSPLERPSNPCMESRRESHVMPDTAVDSSCTGASSRPLARKDSAGSLSNYSRVSTSSSQSDYPIVEYWHDWYDWPIPDQNPRRVPLSTPQSPRPSSPSIFVVDDSSTLYSPTNLSPMIDCFHPYQFPSNKCTASVETSLPHPLTTDSSDSLERPGKNHLIRSSSTQVDRKRPLDYSLESTRTASSSVLIDKPRPQSRPVETIVPWSMSDPSERPQPAHRPTRASTISIEAPPIPVRSRLSHVPTSNTLSANENVTVSPTYPPSRFSFSTIDSSADSTHAPSLYMTNGRLLMGGLPAMPSRHEFKKMRKRYLAAQEEAKRANAKMGVDGFLTWDAKKKTWTCKMTAQEKEQWLQRWKAETGITPIPQKSSMRPRACTTAS